MTHCSDEDLILHYYGESPEGSDVRGHLDHCARCARSYRDLVGLLTTVPVADVPERGPQYGLEVWQRIRGQLPDPESPWRALWGEWDRSMLAAVACTLLIAGFLAGRSWPHNDRAAPQPSLDVSSAPASDAQRRVLLSVVADHLDRSGRVLTDVMNAPEGADLSVEQQWADDLLATSRLYRQDAVDAGERSIAAVLDELERALLEIVHSPARATPADLELMRRRIDAAALLFKVKVLGDELQRRVLPPSSIPGRSRVSPSQTS